MRVCSDAVSAHDTNSPSHTTRRVAPCAHPRASGRIRTGPTCTTTAAVTPGWVRSLGRRHLGGAGSVCGLSSVRMKRCARPHAASSVQRTPPTWMGSAGRAWMHNAAGVAGLQGGGALGLVRGSGCNPVHPGDNPVHPGCNPLCSQAATRCAARLQPAVHPGCNPMHQGCSPMCPGSNPMCPGLPCPRAGLTAARLTAARLTAARLTTAILTMARHVLELVEQVCEAERLGGLRVLAVGLLWLPGAGGLSSLRLGLAATARRGAARPRRVCSERVCSNVINH